MSRPLALDLFCCAGGAARGYTLAGFDVVGVDHLPQPRYVGAGFRQGDAVATLAALVRGEGVRFARRDGSTFELHLHEIAVIVGSPPCQPHSDLQKQSKRIYADFIPQTRELLQTSGLPYILENVEGAPLLDPILLCGAMFPELRVYRHRLFESNVPLAAPHHPRHVAKTFTHDKRKAHYGQPITEETFFQVTGGGNATVADKARAMGIDWMTGRELNEALPPVYTRHLGAQLLLAVQQKAVAA